MKEGVQVVIDLQFYDLMTEKEQSSLIKQLGYCHSVNRRS
jgi:Trm5-related predicted tRNA methylase